MKWGRNTVIFFICDAYKRICGRRDPVVQVESICPPLCAAVNALVCQVLEMCTVLYGRRGRFSFLVLFITYFIGGLWGYAAVFASSLAENIGVPFLRNGNTLAL